MSSYVIAPRLLKHDDNVLNAALDNDARKRPESPGTFENKSDIANGISSLLVLILPEEIGSHSMYGYYMFSYCTAYVYYMFSYSTAYGYYMYFL